MSGESATVVAIPTSTAAVRPPPTVRTPATPGRRSRPGRVLAAASVLTSLVGSVFVHQALTTPGTASPPQPPPWAARAVPATAHHAPPLAFSRPTRVSIARVGIHADVLALGLGQGGGVGVPQPGKR
ncbi:hypothetical protein ACFQ9X_05205 [Catenulispora yoronensis]